MREACSMPWNWPLKPRPPMKREPLWWTWRWRRRAFSGGPCSTTGTGMPITTPSAPLSNRCGGPTPDASLYWLAKMVHAGEDPRFMFRRMLILASEDVGLADPAAVSAWSPPARMPLTGWDSRKAAIIWRKRPSIWPRRPKSNSIMAFFDALHTVEEEGKAEVPSHLKDANRDKKGFGHGEGYLYPHAYRDHWTAQQYLPDYPSGKDVLQPVPSGL